jgi:predicted Zn-dependent protease
VAGVLAHEIGHVRERHVMQGLLRQMGLAVVLGGFDGSGGSSLNSLLSTTYTRGSEREADDHSLKALKQANVSPVGAPLISSTVWRRWTAVAISRTGRRARWPATRPATRLSDERRKLFEKAVVKGSAYKPALTAG